MFGGGRRSGWAGNAFFAQPQRVDGGHRGLPLPGRVPARPKAFGRILCGMSDRTPRVLVPLAAGFEEIEAVTIIDVLRRAEIEVFVAGLAAGPAIGSHGISVVPDGELDEVASDWPEAIVLPGGMPGTVALREDPRVLAIVKRLSDRGKTVAAICAAPTVLSAAGIEASSELTSHPSVRGELGAATVVADRSVVRSGNLITSQGAGTAMEFALALVAEWVEPERARELASAMVVSGDLELGS